MSATSCSTSEVDILIAGAGIVGLTAALEMAALGHRVAVLERGSIKVNGDFLKVFALNSDSQAVLANRQVWAHLEKKDCSAYETMLVWDALSQASLDFDARLQGRSELGHIVSEAALKAALLFVISQHTSISLYPDSLVKAVQEEEDGVQLSTSKGSFKARLLIIADGAQSTLRSILGIGLHERSYREEAIVATIRCELPHQKRAAQIFHPEGPLAFLPLAEPNVCSIVWSSSPSRCKILSDMEPEAFNQALTEAFQSKLGRSELISERRSFPLIMRHVKQYAGKRWVIIGDAAHSIHPLAGLGLNLGLADVKSLSHYLQSVDLKMNFSRPLQAYQRSRKEANWRVIYFLDLIKMLFSKPHLPLVGVRSLGLGLVNTITPLKRWLMTQAMGQSYVER